MSIAWVVNDVACRKNHDFLKIILSKNDTFCLGRTAKMEIPSFYKFNTKHV